MIPITFGFVAINNTGTNGITFNTTGAYDNWTVSVTTVPLPEPASLSGLVLGAVLLKRPRSSYRTARFSG